MKLIDADLLMDNLGFDNTAEEHVGIIITREDVDRMPTAFDVKKVVKELDEEVGQSDVDFKSYAEEHGLDGEYDDCFYEGMKRAIEIVKRGGRKC